MSKVRNIIEAADAAYDEIAMALEMTPTVMRVDEARRNAVPHIRKFHDMATPEHVALMEAVCEADAGLRRMSTMEHVEDGMLFHPKDWEHAHRTLNDAANALRAYREKEGLL